MNADISSLRFRLEQGWQGEAAAVTAADNLNDEGSELEKVTRQLTSQLAYNNELLRQLQQLEEQQLASQKDAAEKKVALRQALGVNDSIRADLLDMKRKTALAQEQAARAAEEANRARVEAGIRQREVDGMQKFVEESKVEISALRAEADDARREVDRARREVAQLREELAARTDDEQVRNAERRADIDAAVRDAAQAKARVGPLEAELRAERARATELADALRERNEEFKQVADESDELRKHLAQVRDRIEHADQVEGELLRQVELKTKAVAMAEGQVQAARELVVATEQELRAEKKRANDAVASERELASELRDCKTQLEAVGNDLASQASIRRSERERFEARLQQVHQEAETSVAEARARERAMAEESARREQEVVDTRRASEDAKAKLQNENQRLNELLQGMQREHAASQGDFQAEREQYEARLVDAARRQRAAESALNSRDLSTQEEHARLRERLVEAQQQLSARTRVHVESLAALEGTMHKLTGECQRLQSAHDGLLDEVASLRAATRDFVDRGNGPLEEWHADTRRAMQTLAEAMDQATEEAASAREAQTQAESARDEEKSRAFVSEEERARMEDELRVVQDHAHAVERDQNERIRAFRVETDALVAARNDLEGHVRRLQDQLERSNAQCRSMQEDVERAGSSLVDAQARARERVAQLEDRLSNAESELAKSVAARDAALAEHGLMKRKLEGLTADMADLQRELAKVEDERRGAGVRENREIQEASKKLAGMGENVRKLNEQLASTKSLLSVVQEQRKHLQDENMALRQELDDVLQSSLQPVERIEGGE